MELKYKIQQALNKTTDRKSFIQELLVNTLNWPIPSFLTDLDDMSYEWSEEDLNAAGLTEKSLSGPVLQMQKIVDNQPWGIFILEFDNPDIFITGRGLTTPLRKVLRGLIPKRQRSSKLPAWDRENLLFVCTCDYKYYRFAYFKPPKDKGIAPLITFGWEPDIPVRTVCEFNLPSLVWPENIEDAVGWTKKWKTAFDKQKLTDIFFKEYKEVFDDFEKDLAKQTEDRIWAHDYALQFLNRCMFLYFIEKKGWLGGDRDFLMSFWRVYKGSKQAKDTFFENWLKVMFFEAFNNRFHGGHGQFPSQILNILALAPYLNGGLFNKNPLDCKCETDNVKITDQRFEQIITFLDRYNFTITEDTPLDIEVAVDAEMLGMVYESLVNISEDDDRRGEAGIFYTPRVEIDLMCRLSLTDYLANHLGENKKNLLYEWVFAQDTEQKQKADSQIVSLKLTEPLSELLDNIKVVDPACGSGSFLVGMLSILDDLRGRLEQIGNKTSSIYNRRREIIGNNLYGVDVKDWACHVAELRLWLAIIIDAQFTKEELHIRKEPLLPNFSFNIRFGDSLVQQAGGVDMAHRRGAMELSQNIKRKLTELKNEKIRFYNNDPDRKYDNPDQIAQQEVIIFRELLADRIQTVDRQTKDIMRIQAETQSHQQRNLLTGELEGPAKQFTLEQTRRENEIQALMQEKQSLEAILDTVRDKATVPFVWDVAFAEIFSSDKAGFDIVIGNPPYVRQENIADPKFPRGKITTENKKEYKGKLSRSVYKAYPAYFDYKAATDKAGRQLDKKSDLYIYFYFHGLSLLNPEGSFCFITSNSWLDVGYGSDLQEFLLRRCNVKMIIDNKAKRSFKQADVNTIIVLFGPPKEKSVPDEVSLQKQAKFIMFNVPFEQAPSSPTFELIENTKEKLQNNLLRVFPITQSKLLEDGCQVSEDEEAEEPVKKKIKSAGFGIKIAKYIGNKWGGKYLRAPDIYWTILEKGKGKLVRLGDIAEVRRGFTTGCNEFFYLDEEKIKQWSIEPEFLKPIIKSPRECKRILTNTKDLKYKIFLCHKDKNELKGTAALEYINWGEKQGFNNRPSCLGRLKWWELDVLIPTFIERSTFNRNHDFPYNKTKVTIDKVMYGINPLKSYSDILLGLSLNSSVTALQIELYGSLGLGLGALFISVEDSQGKLCMLNPSLIPNESESILNTFFSSNMEPFHISCKKNDRIALDSVTFDILNLTTGERDAVYDSVIDLVESRLKKASSLED
jgi:type I restriction-modification system DNA methylase subunit